MFADVLPNSTCFVEVEFLVVSREYCEAVEACGGVLKFSDVFCRLGEGKV
jgi:hypothetical protein